MLIASEEDACGERHAADGCVTHGKFLPFVIVELVGEIDIQRSIFVISLIFFFGSRANFGISPYTRSG